MDDGFEMKREIRGRQVEMPRDFSGHQAVGSVADEQAKKIQTGLGGQRLEETGGGCGLHVVIMQQYLKYVNR